MYSGGSGLSIDIHFVDLEVSYDVLSLLLIVMSKHFNHPHPYIEIATAISDNTLPLTLLTPIVLSDYNFIPCASANISSIGLKKNEKAFVVGV